MRILRIILRQNETHNYTAWPRNLTTENGLYDLRLEQDWSLAKELGRDEERLVHKFIEYNVHGDRHQFSRWPIFMELCVWLSVPLPRFSA